MQSTSLNSLLFATTIALILFFSGCITKLGTGPSSYSQDYAKDLNPVSFSNSESAAACKVGSCWCMVCKNGISLFPKVESLIGGYCYFEKECTTQKASDLSSGKLSSLAIRHFLLGQGPTFSDFSNANPYCSDRLSMSVQWLVGDEKSSYQKPDPQRTMCFLSKDVIPVYLLYSGGKNIDIVASREIGEILGKKGKDFFLGKLTDGPVGPVIVVTEVDFPKEKADQVANQVRAIDQGCGNDRKNNKVYCTIAVSPKIGDVAALDAVMENLNKTSELDKVDLVSYGINGKYAKSCDPSNIRLQARTFSVYSRDNWSKPTIIPYVLFDNTGSDAINSCTWNEQYMIAAYSSFFPYGISFLESEGVIGIAPYSFNATTYGISNPLGCSDCALAKTPERLAAWYSGCQKYVGKTVDNKFVPEDQLRLIFKSSSGTTCPQNTPSSLFNTPFNSKDILSPQVATLAEPVQKLFSCDACLTTKLDIKAPFNFAGSGGKTPDDPVLCTKYPEIELWASARNIDPMLVRAIIINEGGFGSQCTVEKVCSKEFKQKSGSGCFDPSDKSKDDPDYSWGYDYMYDPSGECNQLTFDKLIHAPNAGSAKSDWRFASVGLMQSTEPPYTYWPAGYSPDGKDGLYYNLKHAAPPGMNLDLAKSCNPYFNPFDAADSVCVGTGKVEFWLLQARDWIVAHHKSGELNWEATDDDKDNVFAAYIAMEKYAGYWDTDRNDNPKCSEGMSNGNCWAKNFKQSWSVTEDYCISDAGISDNEKCVDGKPNKKNCYGYTDFVEYVANCEVKYFKDKNHDPGARKMSSYFQFADYCSKKTTSYQCPDWKAIYSASNKTPPKSGSGYLPDTIQ